MPTPLQTERLTLRPYALSDIPALVPLIGAREVAATTLRIPHPYTESDAREFIARMQEGLLSGSELRLGIVVRESNTLCGGVGLRIEADHRRAELGYWIGVPYWGNGYATEAASAVVKYGFETLRLNRIFASHFANNPASAKVLRKIGMRHEGCLRAHVLKWGEFLDLEMYGMLAFDVEGALHATGASPQTE
ncbi:MAG: GNAT family N-acetyltransferase [Terriglobales bacterium]|jgi:RimJ/RimL family protein N-acetyltransferase